jgi:putative toxin-antitoxin system antitoxin component (TIGR02293 family)
MVLREQIIKAATDMFEGDRQKAMSWLSRPKIGLGERIPLDLIEDSDGAEAVLTLIHRLEHSVLA